MTLPASIRVNTSVPFPSLVQGSGPITLTKVNGVWTIGLNIGLIPGVLFLNVEDQVLSGGANIVTKALPTGSITVDCGARPLQSISNNGAFTITAPLLDGNCILLVTNTGSAGAITFSGFTVGALTGDTLTTTTGHKFSIQIWRINGTAGYRIAAHQ